MIGGIFSTENRTTASAPQLHFPGQPSSLNALLMINPNGTWACLVASFGSSSAHLQLNSHLQIKIFQCKKKDYGSTVVPLL
jgi:hypothetical protein